MRYKRLLWLCAGSLLVVGCDLAALAPLPKIVGSARSPDDVLASGIVFGGEMPYLTAFVGKVAVETFGAPATNAEGDLFSQRDEQLYDVAATAYVSSAVNDSSRFAMAVGMLSGVSGTLRFRLLSTGGVVLEEEDKVIAFSKGERKTLISVRFRGLSRAELAKASELTARWVFP